MCLLFHDELKRYMDHHWNHLPHVIKMARSASVYSWVVWCNIGVVYCDSAWGTRKGWTTNKTRGFAHVGTEGKCKSPALAYRSSGFCKQGPLLPLNCYTFFVWCLPAYYQEDLILHYEEYLLHSSSNTQFFFRFAFCFSGLEDSQII